MKNHIPAKENPILIAVNTQFFQSTVSVLLVTFLVLVVPSNALSANWPGWRGPARNGVSSEKDIPVEWSADTSVQWKVPLPGSGISSPIIWEDKVFLTASNGPKKDELHIICLSRVDGTMLWHRHLWGTAPTRHHDNKSSMASPTPMTNGQHIFAFFGTGDVFCLDLDGEPVWHRSLASEYGKYENRFSATSSPLLYRNLLLIQCDHYGESYVLAVNTQSGVDEWKRDRPETWLSWSSPQLVPTGQNGYHELILCSSEKVDALDPLTSKLLWTVHGMQRECIPTPVVGHGLIYVVSGPNGSTMAIQPGGHDNINESRIVWEHRRGSPYVPSAIVVGNYYYLISDAGILTCLEAKTGEGVWRKRLPGGYTASPIASAKHIYFVNEAGETTVIQAHMRKFERVARNSVGESVIASPAISQGTFFLRTNRHLYCFASTSKPVQP